MTDLISRQDVLDYINTMPSELTSDGRRMVRRIRLTEYIANTLPSAEPEQKKGEWIYDGIRGRFPACKCSICGHYENADWALLQGANFCSNCGADMRGD